MKYTSQPILFKSIKDMPLLERPREKLANSSPEKLSDLELICILIGSGTRNRPIQDIASDILDCISISDENNLFANLSSIDGVGNAKASLICSAVELGRRLRLKLSKCIKSPEDAYKMISHYGDRLQEHFIAIILNGAMEVIGSKVITIGIINKTLVHPREVFSYAIAFHATSLIIAHNHPSGNLNPSAEDLEVTSIIRKAGDILGIQLTDHIIFSDTGFKSLRESGDYFF